MTEGGPPTTYTWTRNGAVVTSNSSYSISIAVTEDSQLNRINSGYTGTLRVIGNLPGLYQYSVTNRATATTLTSGINIEG